MSENPKHIVNVINSQSGINVYSTIDRGNYANRKLEGQYKSWDEAQSKTVVELRGRDGFARLYNGMKNLERLAVGAIVVRDAIGSITNSGEHNDLLPILGLIGMYFVTLIAGDINHNNAVLTENRLLALKKAAETNEPQHQQIFPLGED